MDVTDQRAGARAPSRGGTVVRVRNRQQSEAVCAKGCHRLLVFLLSESRRHSDGAGEWAEITLLLEDDRGISLCHERCFGTAACTDVVSQAYAPVPGMDGRLGEIVVNVEQAIRLGPRYAGPAQELALYIAHGCDHLQGADDHEPAGRRAMRRRELRWIRRASAAGLVLPILAAGGGTRQTP